MTREEAIKTVIARHARLSFASALSDDLREVAESDVDNFVALGMLKLDEPKSAQEKFGEAFRAMNVPDRAYLQHVLEAIDSAGLKIVEK